MTTTLFLILHLGLADIIDIVFVAAIIYFLFRWIKDSSAVNILIAILFILILRVIAIVLDLKMMSALLGTILDVGVLALVVIFQPEIRRFLNKLGRGAKPSKGNRILRRLFNAKNTSQILADDIDEICKACEEMGQQKTGALIVLPNNEPVNDIVETGDIIDAKISKRLIMNIFFKNSPLHDGAMIISGDRILAARCTLPMTERSIPAQYGMRHKAAVGMSERSGVDVIVVSEETGGISLIRGGEFTKIESVHTLKQLLTKTDDGHQTGE